MSLRHLRTNYRFKYYHSPLLFHLLRTLPSSSHRHDPNLYHPATPTTHTSSHSILSHHLSLYPHSASTFRLPSSVAAQWTSLCKLILTPLPRVHVCSFHMLVGTPGWKVLSQPSSTCKLVHEARYDRQFSSPTMMAFVLLGAFFGLFGDSDEEDPTKVPPSVKRHLLNAQRHRRNTNYHRAEKSCHKALKILASSKHASSQVYTEGRAYVMDSLANIYLEQGQLDKAEVNFKETMKIMLSVGMEQDSEAMIEISLKLAKIYTNQARYPLAGEGFLWCRDKARERWQKAPSTETHALLGMCVHSLGQYYLAVGDSSAATLAFREALDIARQVYGEEDLQVGVLLNDLGTALDAQGLFKEAEEAVVDSLEIVKSNDSADGVQEHLAVIECNLAEIQTHLENRTAARESCKRALAFAKKVEDKLFFQTIEKKCLALTSGS